MNGLRSFSARDVDDSGTAVIGLGLLARVDDTADEATTDEGWDGEVALLEDALRYARMVSVAYGHLVGNLLMFSDLDTSSRSTEDSFSGTSSPRKTLATEQHGLFGQVEE